MDENSYKYFTSELSEVKKIVYNISMQTFTWNVISSQSSTIPFFQKGSALTIGSFDGPHIGHTVLFDKVLETAKKHGLAAGVVTFVKPLPGIKYAGNYLGDISTLRLRLAEYEKRGFDFAIVIDFTKEFSRIEGTEFLGVLANVCKMKYIVEGQDFNCGKDGLCVKERILTYAQEKRFVAEFIPSVMYNDHRVSSSLIRMNVESGDFKTVSQMLGRSYYIDLQDVEFVNNPNNSLSYRKNLISQVVPTKGKYAVTINDQEIKSSLEVNAESIILEIPEGFNGEVQSIAFC